MFASTLADAVAPTISGIISIGAAVLNAVLPPTSLPPAFVSPWTGFTLPVLKPLAAPTLRAVVPVTPPLVVARGATTTPSGTGSRIYEPAPAPVVKKVVAPVPPKQPVKGVNTTPTRL